MICCSSWFRLGFWCLSPFLCLLSFPGKGFCCIMMCWFLLVPARVVVLVSLSSLFFLCFERGLFHHDVLVFRGSGSGAGACLPSYLFLLQETGLCSITISCFLQFWFRCLSPFFLLSERGLWSISISWFLLVPGRVPVLMSLPLPPFDFLKKTVLFHCDCRVRFYSGFLCSFFEFSTRTNEYRNEQ